MTHLDRLEQQSIYILREAFNRVDKLGMLWSIGKDSNTMVWLARKAFFGRVPFPVIHLDTGREFPETYAFRDRYAAEWNLNLIADLCPPLEQADPSLPPASRFAARKTEGLKAVLARYGFTGIVVGIRRDEQATRAKERVFSPRGAGGQWDYRRQPPEFWDHYNTETPPGTHLRVHPLLHWTEIDVWSYIAREAIPVVSLYFAREGRRYRSLGEEGITFPIESRAASVSDILAELARSKTEERAGRAMDHEAEDAFERLRADGYM
jgi:sulfate adenylyltransferase subunit 2